MSQRYGRSLRFVDEAIDFSAQQRRRADHLHPRPDPLRHDYRHDTSVSASPLDSADRYIRTLEKELEHTRHELDIAVERARNPEALQELNACRDELLRSQNQVSDLSRQMQRMQEDNDMLQRQLADRERVSDQLQASQRTVLDLEREVSRMKESLDTSEARARSLQDRLDRAADDARREQSRMQELQKEMEDMRRQLSSNREAATLEANRRVTELDSEVTSLRQQLRTKDHDLRLKDQSIESMNQTMRRDAERAKETQQAHERTVAELRSARERIEEEYKSQTLSIESLNQQIKRLEHELDIAERDSKHQKGRIEQLEETNTVLRETNADLEKVAEDRAATINELQSRVDELDSRARTAEELRKESEGREARLRELYGEIGVLVGASEAQKQTGLVITRTRELLSELERLQHNNSELRRQHDQRSAELENRQLKIDQLQRELTRVRDGSAKLDSELTSVREELLLRTREVKELTLTHEHQLRDRQMYEERIYKLEDDIDRRNRTIKELERARQDEMRRTDASKTDLEVSLNRLEKDFALESRSLQDRLVAAEEEARNARPYVELCRHMSMALRVDQDKVPAAHALSLRTAFDELVARGKLGHSGVVYNESWRRPDESLSASMSIPRPGTAHRSDTDEVRRLRTELREGESRWIQLRVQFDNFRRSVAQAIHSKAEDSDGILDDLKDYVHRHHGHHRSHSSSKHEDSEDRSNRLHKHNDKDYRRVKKRLETALKTIESQDIWIDLLTRKLEELDANGRRFIHTELDRLQGQVGNLKSQLFGSSKLGASSMSAGATDSLHIQARSAPLADNVEVSDIVAFKQTIAQLEETIRRHRAFREQVIRALGFKTISIPDADVLRAIDDLTRKAGRSIRS